MSKPVLLQNRFDGGMKPDLPRDQLPKNAVWSVQDFLPDISDRSGTSSAPLLRRGGWVYFGSLLTSLNAAAGNVRHVCYAPFSGGAQVVAFDDSLNRLFDLTNSVDRGNAQNHVQAPIFYRDMLIIGTTIGGASPPLKYTGSGAPAALGGSPPNLATFAVYKDRLLGSGSSADIAPGASSAKIYFSGAGAPESWDTTNAWIATSSQVRGLAPLRDGVLVFHDDSVEIIRGAVPPSATNNGGDMSLSLLFRDTGIYSPNSFAIADDKVFWADQSGIYMTDGAAFTDLTKEGGIKNYWVIQTELAGSGFCAVGVYRGFVWVSLLNSSRSLIAAFVCNYKTRSWFQLYNINAKNFASQYGTTDAFYFSNQTTKRAGELSVILAPGVAGRENDPNGNNISPTLNTPYYRFGSHGKSRLKSIYVTYDMRESSTPDNPVLNTFFEDAPDEDGSGGTLDDLTETTTMTRTKLPVGRSLYGVQFAMFQSNDSFDTRIYSIEADVRPLESGRR